MESKEIERIVEQYCEKDSFSGAVLVQKDEHIIFERGFGYANRNEQIFNSPHTRFGMASGCKIFTSVAICQLVEKGILTFDTYIKDCLDISFPHFDSKITIHHLLTHTSGIPDYFDEEVMSDFEELWEKVPMYLIQSPKDFLPMFQYNHMKFEPGSKFSYCNSGFILLGLIIEKVTGISFIKYVKENIFDVCEMNDSGYFRMDQLPKRTALGYIDGENGQSFRTNIYSLPIVGGPDGGAFTTVHDLEKFWSALLNMKLLNKEYTDQLLIPRIHDEGDFYYGYGVWMLMRNNEVFKYMIIGSDPGVRLQSSVFVKSGIHTHIVANNHSKLGIIGREMNEFIEKKYL